VTWCLVFVYSVHKHGPASCDLDLVPGPADLVAADLVAADLVAVDLVAGARGPRYLVRALVAASPWCRGPRRLVRAPWCLQADPGAGAQKTGRVASCAGISPFSHGQFHVKQFSGPAIKGPLC
jgi:hypothetical protein